MMIKVLTANCPDFTPMMSKITATLGRNFSKTKEFQELQEQDGAVDKRLVSMTLKRQDKIGHDIKQRMMEEEEGVSSYSKWLDARPTSNMEKLHFITGQIIDDERRHSECSCPPS